MRIGKYEIKKKKLTVLLSAFIVPFNLYSLVWFRPSPYVHRGIFMSVFILLVALMSPSKSKVGQILMALFTLMALTGTIYPMIFEEKLLTQNLTASSTEVSIFIIFAVGLAALLTRVPVGISILVMSAATGVHVIYSRGGEDGLQRFTRLSDSSGRLWGAQGNCRSGLES
jgi:TRAP-type uncharacterized transport system fused permease subunit